MAPFASEKPIRRVRDREVGAEFGRERLAEAVAAWEDPARWSRELNLLGYSYEEHASEDDPLRAAAEAVVSSPLFKATINVSLAIRKALRRYLGIEPVELSSKIGESR